MAMIRSFLQVRVPAWPIQDPAAAGRTSEISLGGQAQILVFWGGDVRNERALFGRRDGAPGEVIASEHRDLGIRGAQAAVWETQRCLVPMTGFSVGEGAHAGSWICEDRGPLFAVGVRSAIATREGFHLSCFSLLTQPCATRGGGPPEVPVLIGADDVIEWFYLDGEQALQRVKQAKSRRFLSALAGPQTGTLGSRRVH
ncbi:hypothetical protein JR065_03695 [Xanthomonas sp. AmX2]|uniref:hypothetical protein n=1 Tax=Xanthomonas sp. TaxID=29446 RepID=UPI001980B4AF|nr:hypothetical protein [Xanthomonas sp.]MBN6149430.1 hypothetical protein [Xanthomonas sp.]